MARQKNSARTIVTLGMLVLGALVASSSTASAMVQYKVWYFDDNNDWFEEGDVSIYGVKLNPPAWACTLRFFSPSYYRWVDGSENTMSSTDFLQDVRVHLPRPGCPESDIVIKLLDGTVIPYTVGASYLEISTNGAINWLDADGSNHACGFDCVTPGGFKYLKLNYSANVVPSAIDGVQGMMFAPQQQTLVPAVVAGLRSQVSLLDAEVRKQVKGRRTYHLGDREASVRALEDAALGKLAEAGRKLMDCEGFAGSWRFAEAFVAAEGAADSINAVQSLLQTAEFSFPSRSQ